MLCDSVRSPHSYEPGNWWNGVKDPGFAPRQNVLSAKACGSYSVSGSKDQAQMWWLSQAVHVGCFCFVVGFLTEHARGLHSLPTSHRGEDVVALSSGLPLKPLWPGSVVWAEGHKPTLTLTPSANVGTTGFHALACIQNYNKGST